mgnify:CR=1 FL=1
MEVKIEKLDNFGRGITYLNNKICFVENAYPEEVVEIEIIKENKKIIEAKAVNVIKKSNSRVESLCPYSKTCGGCNFSNLKYEDELKYKTSKVKDLILKFTSLENIVEDTSYINEYNYRNKITLHGKDNKLGLYEESTNTIVEIDKCLLVNNKINEIIKVLKEENISIEEALVKTSNDEKQVLVSIKGQIKNTSRLKELSNVLIINDKLETESSSIITNIGKYKFYESVNSFFQINKDLTEKLYDEALNVVKVVKPNKLLDLYCGTGTIGIYVSEYANEIIGIDYNESNIKDANKNKELNNLNNIKFICDKVENQIDNFKDIDMIIVDPPRKGLDPKTKEYLNIIKAKHLVYISCDPVTFARDLNDLKGNYDIEYIKPFNMFPKTYHVENVAYLKIKNI